MKIIKRKAQITMESLLLYGAAILVVLLAIAALTYFGVLDLGSALPDKCNMGATGIFVCEEWRIDSTADTVSIAVRNKGSKPMDISEAIFKTDVASCTNNAVGLTIQPGKSGAINITSCGGTYSGLSIGDKVKGTMSLKHKPLNGQIDSVTTGELLTSLS